LIRRTRDGQPSLSHPPPSFSASIGFPYCRSAVLAFVSEEGVFRNQQPNIIGVQHALDCGKLSCFLCFTLDINSVAITFCF